VSPNMVESTPELACVSHQYVTVSWSCILQGCMLT